VIEQGQRVLGWQPAAAVDTQLAKLEQALTGTSLPLEDAVPLLAARRSERQGGRSRRWKRPCDLPIPTVSPLMIPLVYFHINSFQGASSVEKALPGGENRIDERASHHVEW
jgi:hypothetical protein